MTGRDAGTAGGPAPRPRPGARVTQSLELAVDLRLPGPPPGPARRCGNCHLALAECSAIRSVAFLRLQRTAVATAVLLYSASPRDAREEKCHATSD